ncbi:MAG: hypothetical protein WBD38_08510 [Candidatus Dormiibacterota bacterium]
MRKTALLLGLGVLAGCSVFGSSRPSGTIVVPPPGSPQPDPSGLGQQQPNTNHIHALASRGGPSRLLIGTHFGVSAAKPGASPVPVGGSSPKGDVLQVAYGPDGTAYASGHAFGIQVSRDDGATWALISADVANLDVHGFAVDPTNGKNLYIYAVGKGVLVSSDGGAHWEHRAGYADSHYLTGLAVTADGTLLAGSPELGIAASSDHGSSFAAVRSGTGQVYSLAASAQSADIVVAATEFGIFLTSNGGKDWDIGQTAVVITGISIDPKDQRRFYAGGADGSVFTTTDSGANWSAY